jgi:hypothetical protein
MMDPNDLLQHLKQSVDYSGRIGAGAEAARAFMLGGNGTGGGGSSSGASQQGDFEAVFGSPDSLGGRRTPASSPGFQHRTLPHPHDSPHSPLSFASIAQGNPMSYAAPGSSGLSHHLGSNGRQSVAAHAMLSEQARRLSNTSQSLSPPRPQHFSYSTSVPLAVPGALSSPNGNGQSSIFGTSPFSGSRGLFIPSSYDSNEDGFPRSPPARPAMLGDMQRSNSGSGWTSYRSNEIAIADEEDGDDDDFDEGFLPSSLNDLLTPEEMRRRTLKSQNGHTPSSLSTSSPSLDHFLPSKSVPVDLLLSSGKPSLPPTQYGSAAAPSPWGTVNSSSSGNNPSASPFTPPQSLLAASRASTLEPVYATSPHQQSGLPHPFYSSSFNDALGGPQYASRYPQTGLSPNTNASLAAPGSSLPGGLAAGLSRLHLVPPNYTGETPPAGMLYSQALGTTPASHQNTNGTLGHAHNGGGGTSTSLSSSENPSPSLQGAVLPPQARHASPAVASPLHHEVLAARNGNGNGGVASGGISSAGSTTGEEDLGPEDEIQFDMDT